MAASTPIFTPATDTFGELTLRPAVPHIGQRTRHMAIGAGFIAAIVLALSALVTLDGIAYAQHDTDPYAANAAYVYAPL